MVLFFFEKVVQEAAIVARLSFAPKRGFGEPGYGLALDISQCYIVTKSLDHPLSSSQTVPMPTHVHQPQQHHHPGQGHPPASISPSILRMSVLERLAVAAALIVVLWGAVIWAMKV
jgi:hypothetical protein